MAFSMGNGGPQINVTPMIDVLMVLIIMFMVLVTQQKRAGLEAQIPQPATGEQKEEPVNRTIVIQVLGSSGDKAPTVRINQEEVAWSDLHERLQRIFVSRVEKVAFVKGDDNLDFQYVADVIDIARNSGVAKVGLLPKQ